MYRQLARTRLDHGHGVAAGQSTASISSETVSLVTRYVEEWDRTPGKVPANLMEDIMFRKPVYEAQVLPALLAANMASDMLEVSREQLVTALHSKGKVRTILIVWDVFHKQWIYLTLCVIFFSMRI